MKKTILTMVALGSITTNIFMGFQIHKLNNTIETNCIREEQTHVVSGRYSYGGQVFTEFGHEFIYKRNDYDEIYRASVEHGAALCGSAKCWVSKFEA